MNAISKLLGSHVTTVLQWIRNFAKKQAPKLTLSPGATLVLELDEMWHYLENKKNKLWIWKALDRTTGHLIDWNVADAINKPLKNSWQGSHPSMLTDISQEA